MKTVNGTRNPFAVREALENHGSLAAANRGVAEYELSE